MTRNQIILQNYEQFLSEIRQQITKTQKNILQIVTRQKVEMAWQIGRLIEGHLLKNKQKGYGDHLFEKLESDVGISQTVLYKMHNFYKSYPKIPKDDDKLNWSHYRVLSGVKESEERKRLQNLALENDWTSGDLQKEVKASKISKIRATSKIRQEIAKEKMATKTLLPQRGKLFFYNLIKQEGSGKTCIDCGFKIFKAVEKEQMKALQKQVKIVETLKKNKNYSLKKSDLSARRINIYKAFLKRVVDGDTIHVILDLGFEIFHEEILRLRGINAAEISSEEGKKSAASLKNILKNPPFLIVKTSGSDVYGRYIADVFLSDVKKNLTPQEVADSGIYLNQLLLDKKLATPFSL